MASDGRSTVHQRSPPSYIKQGVLEDLVPVSPPTRPPFSAHRAATASLPTRRRGERSPKAAGLPLGRLLLDARLPHRRSALAFHGKPGPRSTPSSRLIRGGSFWSRAAHHPLARNL
jgi:hypothetical protein